MPISREELRAYPGELPAVFEGVRRGLRAAGVAELTVEGATGTIIATASGAAWGKNLTIRVWQEDPGLVRVKVRSDQRHGIIDGGGNQSALRHLFFAIDHAVAAPQPAAGWYPDPTGRHEQRYWNGVTWTDQVTTAGDVSTDPL